MTALTLDQLLIDLAVTFPGLDAQALPEDPTAGRNAPRAWFHQQIGLQDQWPVFLLPEQAGCQYVPGYVDRIHEGFIVWLARRGWLVFRPHGASVVHLLAPAENPLAGAPQDQSALSSVHDLI